MPETLTIDNWAFEEYGRRTEMAEQDVIVALKFAAAIRKYYDERLEPLWHGWINQVEVALDPAATIISTRHDERKKENSGNRPIDRRKKPHRP
jgi:hypothetical protein